jgi:hypothetical protein
MKEIRQNIYIYIYSRAILKSNSLASKTEVSYISELLTIPLYFAYWRVLSIARVQRMTR